MNEPIRVLAPRYRCPFCAHSRANKQASREHIARCWQNPATRACTTCANWVPPGDGDQCIPGRNCNCNVFPPSCAAGVRLPEEPRLLPVTGCSDWRAFDLEGATV